MCVSTIITQHSSVVHKWYNMSYSCHSVAGTQPCLNYSHQRASFTWTPTSVWDTRPSVTAFHSGTTWMCSPSSIFSMSTCRTCGLRLVVKVGGPNFIPSRANSVLQLWYVIGCLLNIHAYLKEEVTADTLNNNDYLPTGGKVCLLSKTWSPPVIVETLNLTLQREWFSMVTCLTSSSSEKGFYLLVV